MEITQKRGALCPWPSTHRTAHTHTPTHHTHYFLMRFFFPPFLGGAPFFF